MNDVEPENGFNERSTGWLVASGIVFVFGLIAAFQYVTLPKRAKEDLMVALDSKGAAIARTVAHTIAPAVDFDDQPFIDEVFRGALLDPAVVGVRLVRDEAAEPGLTDLLEETLLAEPQDPAQPASEDATVADPAEPTDTAHVAAAEPQPDEAGVVLVTHPVKVAERVVGELQLSLSTANVERQHQDNTRVAGAIAAVLMLVGAATASFSNLFVRQHLAQLRMARDRAEAIIRAKDEFMAAMSHEVRSPLNAVLGMAQALADTRLSSRQRELCRTIVRSGRGLVDLVNRQLDLAKLDAHRLVLAPAGFNLREFVEERIIDFSALAHRKGVDIAAEIDLATPRLVSADRMRLDQMLGNLLSNAVKFTRAGHIAVRVSVDAELDEGVRLKVAVTDTGVGVEPEAAGRLFEPFAQANAEIAGSFGGTGLGLSLVKQLANLMQGTAGVQSEPGRGSTFWFTVVVEAVRPGDAEPPTDRTALYLTSRPWRSSALAAAARSQGVDLIAVESIDLAAASGREFDLLLADAESLDTVSKAGQLQAVAPGAPVLVFGRLDGQASATESTEGLESTHWPASAVRLFDPDRRPSRLDPAPESEAEPDTAESSPVPAFKGAVLLVDDDPINHQVGTIMLESMGFRVTTASRGLEAVELFDGKFDCVLMDMQMPGISGLEAAARIRDLERERGFARTPIFACSAAPVDPQRRLEAGIDAEIPKPLLKEKVRRALEAATRARPEKSANDQQLAPPGDAVNCPPDPKLVDVEIAGALAGVPGKQGASLLQNLVAQFEQRMTTGIQDIQTAIRAGDRSQARAVAHGIKGTSLQLGAREMARELAKAEKIIDDNETELTEGILDDAQKLLEPTLQALRACG